VKSGGIRVQTEAMHDLGHPACALTTRGALEMSSNAQKTVEGMEGGGGEEEEGLKEVHLSTALMLVEVREARNALDNVLGLVHDDDSRSSKTALDSLHSEQMDGRK
jgi:hypothetical protein